MKLETLEDYKEALEEVALQRNRAEDKLEYVADRFASELGLFTPYARRQWIESNEA